MLSNLYRFHPAADSIGLRLISRACYNPSEATQYVLFYFKKTFVRTHFLMIVYRMWVRMEEAERGGSQGWFSSLFSGGSASVDFLSTHPASGKRVKVRRIWLYQTYHCILMLVTFRLWRSKSQMRLLYELLLPRVPRL